ncbi:hypothetical protein ACLBX9_28795 [Methylobacterium sp. A49B]
MKALAAVTALACMATAASTTAKADVYNYSFYANGLASFTGSFEATISGVGSNISSSSPVTITSGTGTAGSLAWVDYGNGVFGPGLVSGPVNSVFGTFTLNNGLGAFAAIANNSQQLASGPVSGTSDNFSFGNVLNGLFSAETTTSSSGGGGGGGSGGAPSPEVNRFLGLALVGGAFMFLRRKRGSRHEATAA